MKSILNYNAAIYARASKDDIDSSTIENQIELIQNYVKSTPEIRIVSVREDNGFSGVDFLRPSFAKMMEDIEAGKINCIIVKDLSRLGRNYIEVGELMEKVLPLLNVRLIAINDNYDSLKPRTDAEEILIPFKNLLNEQYLRDTSVKIRTGLNAKRKSGAFVAAFAPYGYKRDDTDKHKLIIDKHAAGIVADIFRKKIEGLSQQKIANWLNEIGEPSPADYKKRDTNYTASFQIHSRASWTAVAVGRILKNPVYIGTLVQGKQTTPNYKVKKRIDKPEKEWHITTDAHEPIISRNDFEVVSSLLRKDTRIAPKKETVYPFSGIIYCGDCRSSMTRSRSSNRYYYICTSSRVKNKTCTSHCIREKHLEKAVMDAVASQISLAFDIKNDLEYVNSLPGNQKDIMKRNTQIADRESEIKSCERYKKSLYEDYKNGIISKEDFTEFGNDYTKRIEELQQAIIKLREEADMLLNGDLSEIEWLNHFIQYGNLPKLDRQLVVNLIERIEVFSKNQIIIKFRYGDKLETAREILSNYLDGKARCV